MSNKTIEITLTIVVVLLIVSQVFYVNYLNKYPSDAIKIKSMEISSEVFKDGEYIPKAFTCDGEDSHISIQIKNVPNQAKTLALIVNDPDASNGNFVHWTIWNIPARTREIIGDLLPEGAIEGKNSADKTGWISPCPPSGTHHYNFTIHALDTALKLESGAKSDNVLKALDGHIIESASIIGLYQRKQ